jgi:hypothetical protein
VLTGWKQRARQLKREVFALSLALKDPRVPGTPRYSPSASMVYESKPFVKQPPGAPERVLFMRVSQPDLWQGQRARSRRSVNE